MGDFFSRKGLLSTGQRAKVAALPATHEAASRESNGAGDPQGQHPAIAPPAPSSGERSNEVFDRQTVVPDLPPEAHAQALMDALEATTQPTAVPGPTTVSLSFTSMELALDDNPTALGFIELQKRRQHDVDEEARDNRNPLPTHVDSRTQANLEELFDLGDFTTALEVAEARLNLDPNDGVALGYRNRSHDRLLQMLMARVGRLDARVELQVPADQLKWLSVDHRAGFVISLVDGVATLEEILDVAGMPRLEALRILVDLKERGVLGVVR
jgi:hypothetical protein